MKKINTAGRAKLVVIAGAFIQDFDSEIDLLVIGDGMSEAKLEKAVREIESEVGRELRFALFSTSDFGYRMNIYDKLLRNVFDYPHQTILNRLGSQYDEDSFVG
jgi:predicted nucleotidyltransferase